MSTIFHSILYCSFRAWRISYFLVVWCFYWGRSYATSFKFDWVIDIRCLKPCSFYSFPLLFFLTITLGWLSARLLIFFFLLRLLLTLIAIIVLFLLFILIISFIPAFFAPLFCLNLPSCNRTLETARFLIISIICEILLFLIVLVSIIILFFATVSVVIVFLLLF